jgi:hypothetical protein
MTGVSRGNYRYIMTDENDPVKDRVKMMLSQGASEL